MRRKGATNTEYEILYLATKFFLEKGYKDSYVTTMAKTLHMSTGNLTFWFPTKEHILAEMVKELCAFQIYTEVEKKDREYGRGFSRSNVAGMRQFYIAYRDREDEIIQSGIGQLKECSLRY